MGGTKPLLNLEVAVTTTLPPVGPPPPFDPELAAALAVLHENLSPTLTPEMLSAIRTLESAMPRLSDEELARGGRFTVAERSVPGPAGAPDISVLICRPADATEPVGAVYHVHGGGMVLGDNRLGMAEMLDWAEEFHLAVVSVEYRLAPEVQHPGPVEDCYAGLAWTAEHAGELGLDPDALVVAGGSAGGGLAAALAPPCG